MKSDRILILYRTGNYKWKKIKKLTNEDMNKEKTRYLLIPSSKNPLLFYVILPDKRLLSDYFHIKIVMDIANIDFDNDYFNFIDRFHSEYETDSLIDFIEFLSVFYKINGISETMEDSWLCEGMSDVRTIYPVYYKIEFYTHNILTNTIDSGELPNYTDDSELRSTAFTWITNERMDAISDIMLNWDSGKNSIIKLPILLTFNDGNWNKIKYVNNIDSIKMSPDDLIMVRLDGYGSYYLTNYQMFNMLSHTETFCMDLLATNINSYQIESSLYKNIGERFDISPQVERDAFCRYLKEDMNYLYGYTYNLGDIYSLIIWLTFAKDIVTYLHALFHTMEDGKFVICIRYIGKLYNYTFSQKDIMNGKFQEYLSKYIFMGGK